HREDGFPQAEIQRTLWKEIYEQSHGKGGAGTAIGGLIFQWGDGWWKYKLDVNLDIQVPTASWSNGGYTFDFVEGENNMNEEWFGITAKTRNDELGLYYSKPRPAYYVLQRAFKLDP
ncbi:hypothetical protein L6R46_32410, partial [Myxococcota bacterium]|nr:hypothetical protein [Myxococcota bacterium]